MTPLPLPAAPSVADPLPARFRDRVRQRVGESELLLFRVGAECFAVDLRAVDEAVESPDLRIVPEGSETLLGVFPHRGRLIPLYDAAPALRARAGQTPTALVLHVGTRRVALAVDEIEEVSTVDLSLLSSAPALEDAEDDVLLAVLVRTVNRRRELIAVLDARALIATCTATPVPIDL